MKDICLVYLIFYYYLVDIIYKEYSFFINDTHILIFLCYLYILNITPCSYHICQLSITFISHFSYRTYFYADHKRHYPSSHETKRHIRIFLFLLENINQNLCNHIFLDVGHKYMHTSCLIGTATQMSHRVGGERGGTTLFIYTFIFWQWKMMLILMYCCCCCLWCVKKTIP